MKISDKTYYSFNAGINNKNKTNPLQKKEQTNTNSDTFFNKKNIAIAAAITAAAIVFITKRKKSLDIEKSVQKGISEAEKNIVKDNLAYEIQAPKLDGENKPGFETYKNIRENIAKDENTERRFREVKTQIDEDIEKLSQAMAKNGISTELMPVEELAICQKRYFSMPDSPKAKGHSCLDPLLYQKPREEIVDLQLGYMTLEPFQNNKGGNLKYFTDKFKFNDDDINFINDCVNRMKAPKAVNYGENSVIHANEHQRLGKIIREALNIDIR